MSGEFNTYRTPTPVCPHCGYAMNSDDMAASNQEFDLFALAPDEERAEVQCPQCDEEYAVQGGYAPKYTTAFCEEELDYL